MVKIRLMSNYFMKFLFSMFFVLAGILQVHAQSLPGDHGR